jgi:hypothetical protein
LTLLRMAPSICKQIKAMWLAKAKGTAQQPRHEAEKGQPESDRHGIQQSRLR